MHYKSLGVQRIPRHACIDDFKFHLAGIHKLGMTLSSPPVLCTSARMSEVLTGLIRSEPVSAAVFALALIQFLFFTVYTLDQPLIDMYGFRTAQTALSVPYMLSQGAWLNYLTPIFGEPWKVMLEFPLYQWCVALLSAPTGLSVDASGRIVSALFAISVLWPMAVLAHTLRLGRRYALIASALWLLAPVVLYWAAQF
jgi:hypothetical protein